MPQYRYSCTVCGEELDILRSMKESDELPKEDEYKNKECVHIWNKQFAGSKFQWTRGPSWQYRKPT